MRANSIIKIKYKRNLDNVNDRKILRLKGAIIREKFTDVIYIEDQDEENYVSSFIVDSSVKVNVIAFITDYLNRESINEIVEILQ